ncbi:MAG: hypothetical protein GF411_13930 [Candidatus Lokiarchaeota archaeon]|nr:hypothetical protein [Candidatus Lokiarchaeota archaeon]
MKKLIIFCSSWMYNIPTVSGWKVFCNPQEKDPNFSYSTKFGGGYVDAINRIQPDFVLAINVGCSEHLFDQMKKPKGYGTKYITWSTDSYRHTRRATTSDLHLTSIPDSSMKSADNFVPLFFDYKGSIKSISKRKHEFGIHCRVYPQSNHFRQREIKNIKSILGDRFFINQKEMHPYEYIKEIKSYKYGINVGVYKDGLPNFRSFEYGACGVMPISEYSKTLEDMFENNIILYHNVGDIPFMIHDFDPIKLSEYYNTKHSLHARLKYIFHTYFDLEFK